MTTTKATTKPVAKKATKKPLVKKEVKSTNKDATTQKVVINRVLKYSYPKGMTDTLARKAYRQQVRNKLERMQANIEKAAAKDKADLRKKLTEYQSQVLNA